MLANLALPERPTDLDNSWARPYCACSWCEWVPEHLVPVSVCCCVVVVLRPR